MDLFPDKLLELLAQMPVAGLMLVVVWKFLQVIKDRDAYFLGELAKHQEQYKTVTHQSVEVIRQNSVALHQSAKTLEKVEGILTADAYERTQHRRGS